jgi:hypothetical protein
MSCIDHPVSWLILERYYLNELSAAEAERVADHLDACPACAACHASIASDDRPLRPLSEVAAPVPRRLLTWPRLVPALVAAAAVVVIAVLFHPFVSKHPPSSRPARIAYKGGELALTLARERDGEVVNNPDRYLSQDRFRLFVTSPGTMPLSWDVAVFQDGEVFFPYTPSRGLTPGNNVPLPGAFRLTGSATAEICFFTGDVLPSRDTIRHGGKTALPPETVCRTLVFAKGE